MMRAPSEAMNATADR